MGEGNFPSGGLKDHLVEWSRYFKVILHHIVSAGWKLSSQAQQ